MDIFWLLLKTIFKFLPLLKFFNKKVKRKKERNLPLRAFKMATSNFCFCWFFSRVSVVVVERRVPSLSWRRTEGAAHEKWPEMLQWHPELHEWSGHGWACSDLGERVGEEQRTLWGVWPQFSPSWCLLRTPVWQTESFLASRLRSTSHFVTEVLGLLLCQLSASNCVCSRPADLKESSFIYLLS